MKEEYAPNRVYTFQLSLKDFKLSVNVPVKIIKDGIYNTDEFEDDEEAVEQAYFTQERIDGFKKEIIEKIQSSPNPFHIICIDWNSNLKYKEEELFRKTK